MADQLDDDFRKIARDLTREVKRCSRQDQKAVADWLDSVSERTHSADDRVFRNDYGRYLLYVLRSGQDLPEGLGGSGSTAEFYPNPDEYPSTSAEKYSSEDVLDRSTPTADVNGICDAIKEVRDGLITSAAEFIFRVSPFVKDRGALFREILERELSLFREIVDDTIDRRVQDEGDVMMHTQNNVKRRFRSLTERMIQRTIEIRQRLHEISANFDWMNDGKNEAKISRLVAVKRKEMSGDPHATEKLTHEIFMRAQWLKKELMLLQTENERLEIFLEKFRALAAERKSQEARVPRILYKEKHALQKELDNYRKTYKRNMEIIDSLCLQQQRCTKATSGTPDG